MIWYTTLTQRLTGNASFEVCARETVSVARDLFPQDPSIATKVAQAWVEAGVLEESPQDAALAHIAGAYVISPRLREVTVARPSPKGAKKKAALRATQAKYARATPKKRVTSKKKPKSTRSRGK
jgi:hypothetical protein